MVSEDDFFSNLTSRERAIFEGGISMGALFHQFVGTPVSKDTYLNLKKTIESSILLQPAVIDVNVSIIFKNDLGYFDYVSLTGDMLEVEITTKKDDVEIVVCLKFIEALDYPLMYIKK